MDRFRSLRHSLRRLRQRPGFTAVAVLSLGLGIGANTAMFSVLDAIILRDQPFADPGSLVEVYVELDEFPFAPFSFPDFLDLRASTPEVFSAVGGSGFTMVQTDQDGEIASLFGELVSANYFSVLGLEPAAGRFFAPDEDADPGASAVVVLAHEYWLRQYQGDPTIVGQQIRLSGQAFTVVGVAPARFLGSLRGFVPALYVPVSMDAAFSPDGESRLDARGSHWFFVRARRSAAASDAQIATTLATFVAAQKEREAEAWEEKSAVVTAPTRKVVVNPLIDRFVLSGGALLMGLVAVVLTIACANLASFLLARATDQRKELAVRLALGATRAHLVRQQLTDALSIALAGGALGAGLATALVTLVRNARLPGSLPLRVEAVVDGRVLLFCLAASLISALLFGLAPALQSTRIQPAPALKDEGTGGGARKQRLRAALVVAQVGLSTTLLVGAGLFARSLLAMQDIDPGFGREPSAILSFGTPRNLTSREQRAAFVASLRERVAALPGIEAVGTIDNLNLNLGNQQSLGINVDGVEPPAGQSTLVVDYAAVDDGYFEAAGVGIVDGRGFDATRDRHETQPVAIVSAALAERFFAGQSPIGQMLRRNGDDTPDLLVIGVASNTSVRLLAEEPRPFVYLATSQRDDVYLSLIARVGSDARAASREILGVARTLAPDLMVIESKTMDDHLATMLLPSRALAALFLVFALLALALAAIGLYGVVSCTVAARVREVGIRVSLGATGGEVVRLLMRGGMVLVLIGAGAGMALALLLSRLLSTLLFRVVAADPLVFTTVPALLLAVTLLATLLPARRVLGLSPTTALRAS